MHHLQGNIRDNLDPMQQYTDRDMIRVLKDVGLWEILCGISLSNAKDEESPAIGCSSTLAGQEPGETPCPACVSADVCGSLSRVEILQAKLSLAQEIIVDFWSLWGQPSDTSCLRRRISMT